MGQVVGGRRPSMLPTHGCYERMYRVQARYMCASHASVSRGFLFVMEKTKHIMLGRGWASARASDRGMVRISANKTRVWRYPAPPTRFIIPTLQTSPTVYKIDLQLKELTVIPVTLLPPARSLHMCLQSRWSYLAVRHLHVYPISNDT